MLKKKNRILSIYPKKRSKDIFIVHLDNGTTLEISTSILISESIKEGEEIDASNLDNLLSKQEYHNIKNAGLTLLRYRMRSKKELYEKLLAKNYDSKKIKLVLIDFEKNGIINDEEFGLAFSKDQINQNSLGPIALKYKLKKYISSDDMVSKILLSIYSEIEVQSIIFKILKKYTSDDLRENHILRQKIINKLKRKGHYWQDINDSVNKYIEGCFKI